jgi:4-diphosphocytidyl-2-C-methyl-D-erythritol kinase
VRLPGPEYPAPAKLNLFLHVLGRRDDGYHVLQSVFTLVDLCDRIRLAVRPDGAITRVSDLAGVPAERDLVVRAARLLKEATGTRLGVDIEVEKHIPMGGGLGGGSSDAATVLMALDRLWNTRLGADALRTLALPLGADVPFFIFGQSAWAEGIGDRLQPVEVPVRWYAILAPAVVVPTEAVYADPELTRDTEALKMEDFSAQPQSPRFHNDLEAVVTARYPLVRAHLEWLRARAPAAMTGSGGCVFAGFESREAAQRVIGELPASMTGFVARGLTHHPLRTQ